MAVASAAALGAAAVASGAGADAALTGCSLLPAAEDSAPSTGAVAAPPASTTTQPPLLTPYVVVRGDTLITIADRFGIHLNDLVATNNIVDPTKIYVGQLLLIPAPPDASSGPALTIAPATDPVLPPLLPTTSAPPFILPRIGPELPLESGSS